MFQKLICVGVFRILKIFYPYKYRQAKTFTWSFPEGGKINLGSLSLRLATRYLPGRPSLLDLLSEINL